MSDSKSLNKVNLRVLLVSQKPLKDKGSDDVKHEKVEIRSVKGLKIESLDHIDKNLLTLKEHMVKDGFNWNHEGVECFICQESIKSFFENGDGFPDKEIKVVDETVKHDRYKNQHVIQVDGSAMTLNFGNNVQIVNVLNASVAVLLLSLYKFDMIVFDYDANKDDFVSFLKFLSEEHSNSVKAKLSRAVLNNRGPLNRLWILPFAENPNTIIDALRNNELPLIHTRWHIDVGAKMADDIFCKRLQKLIEAQWNACVFDQNHLIRFLTYSGQHLEQIYQRGKNKIPRCGFADFQDYMGAEFSTFLRHYGSRAVIRRDAKLNEMDDVTKKSVFATYVWKSFYGNNNNAALFKLHDLMKAFFMTAATMPEDRNGVMRLRESFRRLRYFIDINDVCVKEGGEAQKQEKKAELPNSMNYFSDCIDVLLF